MPLDPTIKSLIGQFRKSPQWDEHLDLELLQKLWPSLVGEQLAAATRITGIHGATAVLNVPDLIWRKQLFRMKDKLLHRSTSSGERRALRRLRSRMRITEEDVEYVAKLANLEVPESERKELAGQLSRIVEYVEQLNTLDVSSITPTTQILENVKHAVRDDRVVDRTGTSDAGKTVKYFKVPKVITER